MQYRENLWELQSRERTQQHLTSAGWFICKSPNSDILRYTQKLKVSFPVFIYKYVRKDFSPLVGINCSYIFVNEENFASEKTK